MPPKKNTDYVTVYSTDTGRICGHCGQPQAACCCRKHGQATPVPPPMGDGVVRLMLETKGRKGKGVTLVTGLPLAEVKLRELAKQLKSRCGSGGTVKNGVIEIQGDHRDTVAAALSKQGYRVKRAGG